MKERTTTESSETQITHTAGPWTYKPTASLGPQYAVYSETDSRGQDVAIVYSAHNGEANARLIAAAPELLEGLKRIRSTSIVETFHGDVSRFQEWIDSFSDSLIAKAEGRAS